MNQVGVIAHRLAHEPGFRQDLAQNGPTAAAVNLTSEEQAALAALRGHLVQSPEMFQRILSKFNIPNCGW